MAMHLLESQDCNNGGRMDDLLSLMVLVFPLPRAQFRDGVITGQVKVERSNSDITFAKTGDVGFRPFEMERRIVGHPVVCSPARILSALESLSIAAQVP